MKYVVCGTILPAEIELLLPGASPAAGKYLRNLMNALGDNGYESVVCSFCAIPGAAEAFEKTGISAEDQIFKGSNIVKSVIEYHKKILSLLEKDDVVVFYNLAYFNIGVADKVIKHGNKCLLILADHTDSYKENGSLVRWGLAKYIGREFKKFNKAVILSETAKKLLNKNAEFIVMEGGLDICSFDKILPPTESNIVRFMYAGTLSSVTGVDTFLKAISMIGEHDVEFIISGKGELESDVIEACKSDNRIKYLGFIPDDEYYRVLNSVDVFVNPRNMQLDQNRNNFPSKVLEYLATGRRVISTEFPGYERFTDYFDFYEGNADELSACIQTALTHKDNTAERFEKNRNAALDYDWHKQVEKIRRLVEE